MVDDIIGFMRNSPARHGGDFTPFSLLPAVFERSSVLRFKECAERLCSVMRKVLEKVFAFPEVLDCYCFGSEKMSDFIRRIVSGSGGVERIGDLAKDAVSFLRFDSIADFSLPDPSFGICEINSNALGGIAESHFVEKAVEMSDLFFRSSRDVGLEGLGAKNYDGWSDEIIRRCKNESAVWHRAKIEGRKPHFAFVVLFDSEGADVSELAWFESRISEAGMDFSVSDVRELEIGNDGLFFSRKALFGKSGTPIDFAFNYLIFSDLMRHEGSVPDSFFRTANASDTVLFPSPLCFIVQDKRFLAFLHRLSIDGFAGAVHRIMDDEDMLFVRDVIPETFVVSSGDRIRLKSGKDDFVLKPSSMYGGQGVVVGCSAGREEWDAAVDRACDGCEPFIAQRKLPCGKTNVVPISPSDIRNGEIAVLTLFQARTVIGLFVTGGVFSGAYVRAGSGDVVSGAEAAYACAAYGMI